VDVLVTLDPRLDFAVLRPDCSSLDLFDDLPRATTVSAV
jgi:hypothetical protein